MVMEFTRIQCQSQNLELFGSKVRKNSETSNFLNWVALFLQKLGDCRSDLRTITFIVVLLYKFPFFSEE